MDKNTKRLIVFFVEMLAFIAIMIFGIFCGRKHPQIFFWGFMLFFAVILIKDISPTLREGIILVAGMFVISTVGTIIDKFISIHLSRESFIGFLIISVCLAPLYFPLLNFYLKICNKAAKRLKKKLEAQ